MKSTDLRIGNLITSKQWKGAHSISGIELTEDGFDLKVNGYVHRYEPSVYFDIEPIPLTEEWLLKLGFEKEETGIYTEKWFLYKKDDFVLHWRNQYPEFGWLESIEIKYVHQLQNLFYALTGTELEIRD